MDTTIIYSKIEDRGAMDSNTIHCNIDELYQLTHSFDGSNIHKKELIFSYLAYLYNNSNINEKYNSLLYYGDCRLDFSDDIYTINIWLDDIVNILNKNITITEFEEFCYDFNTLCDLNDLQEDITHYCVCELQNKLIFSNDIYDSLTPKEHTVISTESRIITIVKRFTKYLINKDYLKAEQLYHLYIKALPHLNDFYIKKQETISLHLTILSKNLNLFKKLENECLYPIDYKALFILVCSRNEISLIEYLFDSYPELIPNEKNGLDLFKEIIALGNLPIIEYLTNNYVDVSSFKNDFLLSSILSEQWEIFDHLLLKGAYLDRADIENNTQIKEDIKKNILSQYGHIILNHKLQNDLILNNSTTPSKFKI